jgi:hypothetical protein
VGRDNSGRIASRSEKPGSTNPPVSAVVSNELDRALMNEICHALWGFWLHGFLQQTQVVRIFVNRYRSRA